MGALVEGEAGPDPHPMSALESFTSKVILESMAQSTLNSYNRTISHFRCFLLNLNVEYRVLPANPGHLCYYASYLYQSGMAPATIRSKMCAICFVHKLYSGPDPYEHFIFKKQSVKTKEGWKFHNPMF